MEHVEKMFYDASNVYPGQVYVIDNIQTIKVGASHDAVQRFKDLRNNGLYFDKAKQPQNASGTNANEPR